MTDGPTHFTVTGVYAGAHDEENEHPDREAAEQAATKLAGTYRALPNGETWEVFLMPHYCGTPEEGAEDEWECLCARWLTDHHPFLSFEDEEEAQPPPLMACGHAAAAVRPDGSPACPICAGDERAVRVADSTTLDLTERIARCTCGAVRPSALTLAFFEYRGDGSRWATEGCGTCGYHEVAHEADRKGQYVCDSFSARGASDFDGFFCGHSGWN